jgi:predicted DNA-binding protein with PD1-like motif
MTRTHALRLHPGDDLKKEIESFVRSKNIQAGWINCGVGSLTDFHIRFANQPEGNKAAGHFEIVSLTGTLSTNGCHIHISISDSGGKTIGGHLLGDNLVYTTVEIMIQETDEMIFTREQDKATGWKELMISMQSNSI